MFFLESIISFYDNFINYYLDIFFNFLSYFLSLLDSRIDSQVSTNMKDALFMAIKFLICIALLIFARGGIPRFRFDYLTKLGWIRFLSLVLLSFLVEVLILSMF